MISATWKRTSRPVKYLSNGIKVSWSQIRNILSDHQQFDFVLVVTMNEFYTIKLDFFRIEGGRIVQCFMGSVGSVVTHFIF